MRKKERVRRMKINRGGVCGEREVWMAGQL